MPVFAFVIPSCYQDSILLMRSAAQAKAMSGIDEAGLFMGSPANKAVLAQSGLDHPALHDAGPGDILVSLRADMETNAQAAFALVKGLILSTREQPDDCRKGLHPPFTSINAAKTADPARNLAIISVPGQHARHEAMRALQQGLHVFLFSDNVSLEAEASLKREAAKRDLLCMGPDCGTAWLAGLGLGFTNEIPRGKIGIISASGTGLQAVACYLAAEGEGISQGLGVGGRDLHAAIGASMTLRCLALLEEDPDTEVIVLISKPPAPEVLGLLEDTLARLRKPSVVCLLGATSGQRTVGHSIWVSTLAEAAAKALALRGIVWEAGMASSGHDALFPGHKRGGALLGLYTGGTLAYEALHILKPRLGDIAFDDPAAAVRGTHSIIDLGDDAFTVGRPHPMIAPEIRAEWLRKLGVNPAFRVLLLDLVLGRCAHPDPATPLAEALRDVRRANPDLVAVASVVGSARDAQGLKRQTQQIKDAGCYVLPTNAAAAALAGRLLRSDGESPHAAS